LHYYYLRNLCCQRSSVALVAVSLEGAGSAVACVQGRHEASDELGKVRRAVVCSAAPMQNEDTHIAVNKDIAV
jgi:hypothetical protein